MNFKLITNEYWLVPVPVWTGAEKGLNNCWIANLPVAYFFGSGVNRFTAIYTLPQEHLTRHFHTEAETRAGVEAEAMKQLGAVPFVPPFNFAAHLQRQREFSAKTWGPDAGAKGVVDHIRSELLEVEKNPAGLEEWIDVAILALDGAWRAGYSPDQIIAQFVGKQDQNEARTWPDWRTADPEKAIEHERTKDVPPVDLSAQVMELEAENALLQDILDSRPAINAGLPDTYIRWSQALYSGEVARAALAKGDRE
jgi:hypothetical protein